MDQFEQALGIVALLVFTFAGLAAAGTIALTIIDNAHCILAVFRGEPILPAASGTAHAPASILQRRPSGAPSGDGSIICAATVLQAARDAAADYYERIDPYGFGFVGCAIRDGRRDDDPRVQRFVVVTGASIKNKLGVTAPVTGKAAVTPTPAPRESWLRSDEGRSAPDSGCWCGNELSRTRAPMAIPVYSEWRRRSGGHADGR